MWKGWRLTILYVLQHEKDASVAGIQHTGQGLPDSERGRGKDYRQIQQNRKHFIRNRNKKSGQRRSAA